MSFFSTITASGALPTDLVNVNSGGALDVTTTAQVYAGRRRRDPQRTDGEVWVERLPAEEIGTGLQRYTAHPVLLHCYSSTSNTGDDRAGAVQLAEVEALAAAIVARYHGTRRLYGTDSDIVAIDAREEEVDADPEETKRAEAVVRLTFYVRG